MGGTTTVDLLERYVVRGVVDLAADGRDQVAIALLICRRRSKGLVANETAGGVAAGFIWRHCRFGRPDTNTSVRSGLTRDPLYSSSCRCTQMSRHRYSIREVLGSDLLEVERSLSESHRGVSSAIRCSLVSSWTRPASFWISTTIVLFLA